MIKTNPILDELRQTREQLLEEAGGTLDGLVAKLQAEEKKSGRVVLGLPTQRKQSANKAPIGSSPPAQDSPLVNDHS